MNIRRIFAVGFIFVCTAIAWFVLGQALTLRTQASHRKLGVEVAGNWGTPMAQRHPVIYYIAPTHARPQQNIQPNRSAIRVKLQYDPKKKGLLWYRTYKVDFDAQYEIINRTPIRQTIYIDFQLPAEGVRYDKFSLTIGDKESTQTPVQGRITESVILGPGEEVPLHITYWAAGMDRWDYHFGDQPRVQDFQLAMETDFDEINIPAGTESPTSREQLTPSGWNLDWTYSDVIGARSIGMDMPAVVNPGPVATRITFFAPVSLLFFFTVLLIMSIVRGAGLHPMNYFFLAAGCFAFQLLFAYLVDLIPTMAAFSIAAVVSLLLVNGYLAAVAGFRFARLSSTAQFGFMVLFSYSFFFPGLTGLTITIGAIVTLALLMLATAKTDWNQTFAN